MRLVKNQILSLSFKSRMGSIKQLRGAEFVMMNSTALAAKVLSRSDVGRMNSCVSIILKHMIKHDDMFVGLDISWGAPNGALLATYTQIGCVVLDTYSKCVKHVFSNMDITVNGVHMKENVKKFRRILTPL